MLWVAALNFVCFRCPRASSSVCVCRFAFFFHVTPHLAFHNISTHRAEERRSIDAAATCVAQSLGNIWGSGAVLRLLADTSKLTEITSGVYVRVRVCIYELDRGWNVFPLNEPQYVRVNWIWLELGETINKWLINRVRKRLEDVMDTLGGV